MAAASSDRLARGSFPRTTIDPHAVTAGRQRFEEALELLE